MTPAARLSAAIEVLVEIFRYHRPAAEALKDWGKSHRFAGSGDRATIGNLVYDVMRRKGSLAWLMQSEEARELVLALYVHFWTNSLPHRGRVRVGAEVENQCESNSAPLLTSPRRGEKSESAVNILDQLCTGENHAPAPLTEDEQKNLSRDFAEAPPHVQGFYPEWLDSRLLAVYNTNRIKEGAALAERAPIDLRVNTLKTSRDKALTQLENYQPTACKYSPFGIRVAYKPNDARPPHVETEGVYQRGHVELQDEASQLVSFLTGARPSEQIVDFCAGSGGKTLALAALMQNKGQIIASDPDRHRLKPIYERLKRAGVHNVQVKSADKLDEFAGRADRVVLNVPCTGTGAWRRRPDGKWRLKEQNIADRIRQQDEILVKAAPLVRPGGELIYITCSILKDENEDRIVAFLTSEAGSDFRALDMKALWREALGDTLPPQPEGVAGLNLGLRLSPHSSGTDGFYIARLQRAGD